ncbi:hypothetical protein [Jiulongibacter sp. NS-SX5]|uniref:hypothetical protein n=1 Tax=Jiulongibacter sp. NS-SX5 TaxID=3463854 RepID=UPI0040587A4A
MKKIISLFTVILLCAITAYSQNSESITLKKSVLKDKNVIATVEERFQSYNVEMCEVIGGDFWVPYGKMDSILKNTDKKGFAALKWKIEPIDLSNQKLINLARGLGPVYMRVSGTWANDVYFDDSGSGSSEAPEGFANVLTAQQWKGVINFSEAVGAKIVTSFPISDGMRDKNGAYQTDQIKKLLSFTKETGGQIYAAAFFNEPSHANHGNAPKGFNGEDFAREFSEFKNFMKLEAPEVKIMGPGSTGEGILPSGLDLSIDELLDHENRPTFDIFSYHYYGTVSKRCFGPMKPEDALSEEWLSRTERGLDFYENARNKYQPEAPIWLSETGESACGGNPWAATFLDTFRYLEQLGRLSERNVKVVMHNTLTRSEYALLDHDTHNPRPNYWAAHLWSKLMGTQVFQGEKLAEGLDMFVHNLKGISSGKAVLLVNTNETEKVINLPSNALKYELTADELETKIVKLNGKVLELTAENEIPEIIGLKVPKGDFMMPARGIVFLTFN